MSSKVTTRKRARRAKHPLKDAIITRKKAAEMKQQLRAADHTLQKLSDFLNNPARDMPKIPVNKEPRFKLDDITNIPITKSLYPTSQETSITISGSQTISRNTFESLPSSSDNPLSQISKIYSQNETNDPDSQPSCVSKLQSHQKILNQFPTEQDSKSTNKTKKSNPQKTNKHILNEPIGFKPLSDDIKPYVTIKKCSNTKKTQQHLNKSKIRLKVDHEFCPNISRRKIKLKDDWLNPKHDYKTICRVDGVVRRKLFVPRKGTQPNQNAGSSLRQALCSDLDVKELVRFADDQGLDEDDFMEILTCPSPVWWETPQDYDYLEDAIPMQIAIKMDQNIIGNELNKEETKPPKHVEDIPIIDVKINNSDEKFMKKRSKLEQVLGNMKSTAKSPRSDCEDKKRKLSKNCADESNKFNVYKYEEQESKVNMLDNTGVDPKESTRFNNKTKETDKNKELEIDDAKHDYLDITKVVKINSSSILPDIEKYFNGQEDMAVISKVIQNTDENNCDYLTNNDDQISVLSQSNINKGFVEIVQMAVDNHNENHATAQEVIDFTEEDKHLPQIQVTLNGKKHSLKNKNSDASLAVTYDKNDEENDNKSSKECEDNAGMPNRAISTSSDDLHFNDFPDDEMLNDLENMNIPIVQRDETGISNEIIEIPDDEPASEKPTSAIDIYSSPISSKSTNLDSDCASLTQHNLDSISDTNIKFISDDDIDKNKTERNETIVDSANDHSNEFNNCDKRSNVSHNDNTSKSKDARLAKIRNAYSSLITIKSIESPPKNANNNNEIKYCHICSSIYDSEICTYCDKKKKACNIP